MSSTTQTSWIAKASSTTQPVSTTQARAPATDQWYKADRLGGLRRFATAITAFNIVGHLWLGFEQSWAQPLVGLAAAYSMELVLELIDCRQTKRRPRFRDGGIQKFIDFFLPAQISGLACSMLLYANDRLMPIAFAAAVAIASKHLLRVRIGNGTRHFLNPSNFGITATLLLFPWVGIAMPYHFTENLTGLGNVLLPCFIIVSGSFLNIRYTRRWPLLVTWLCCFVAQALLRHWMLGASLSAALMPMTGVAFILFTFYMVTDPPTTPSSTRGQVLFGASVAAAYGLLMVSHIVFGLFFALTIVCSIRGIYLYVSGYAEPASVGKPREVAAPSSVPPPMIAPVRPAVREPVMARRAD
jgi:hypothetical protein